MTVSYTHLEETGAIIQLYDKESRIVWESMDGRYYTDSITYETKRLFYEPRFMEMCKKYEDEAGMWKKTGEVVEVKMCIRDRACRSDAKC